MAVLWNHDKKWSWSLQVVWLRYLSVARWCSSIQDPHCEEELGETCLISCAAHRGNRHLLLLCPVPPCASSAPSVSGYRHVYLEGIEEASIFVHVAINDICGKVSVCAVQHPHRSCQDLVSHQGEGPGGNFCSLRVKLISVLVIGSLRSFWISMEIKANHRESYKRDSCSAFLRKT